VHPGERPIGAGRVYGEQPYGHMNAERNASEKTSDIAELAWWLIRDPAAPRSKRSRPTYVEAIWDRTLDRAFAMMDMTKGIQNPS
jgi:hypothetical protein